MAVFDLSGEVKNYLGLNRDFSDEEKESIRNAIKSGWSYTSAIRAKGTPITINIPKMQMPTFVFNPTKEYEILSPAKSKKQYRSIDEPFESSKID